MLGVAFVYQIKCALDDEKDTFSPSLFLHPIYYCEKITGEINDNDEKGISLIPLTTHNHHK